MMMSRRPVSSPGRVDKYPPTLVRFLRSNSSGGSRSRSRSRGRSLSSPLFVRWSKGSSTAGAAAVGTQEPSSPKVTCMGQVRVRRSKQQSRANTGPGLTRNPKQRCDWIRNAAFCYPFAGKLKTRSFFGSCLKWESLKFFNFRRNSNNSRSQSDSRVDTDSIRENKRDKGEHFRNPKNSNTFVSPASTPPPRNALLLTRSRSAPPYRSSSLAFRFWEADNNLEIDERNSRDEQEDEQRVRNSRSSEESISRNWGQDPESDRKIVGVCESEKENEVKSDKKEEEELGLGFIRPPPMLTRCKSEPARIGERLRDEGEG